MAQPMLTCSRGSHWLAPPRCGTLILTSRRKRRKRTCDSSISPSPASGHLGTWMSWMCLDIHTDSDISTSDGGFHGYRVGMDIWIGCPKQIAIHGYPNLDIPPSHRYPVLKWATWQVAQLVKGLGSVSKGPGFNPDLAPTHIRCLHSPPLAT